MILPKWLEADIKYSGALEERPRYWFRTTMGLETLVADELRRRLPVMHAFESHRNVFLQLATDAADEVCRMRSPDDVYRLLGYCNGIDHTRPGVEKLITYFSAELIPFLSAQSESRHVRLTLSFVGKRNYSRFFVENRFNELLSAQTDLIPLSNEEKAGKQAGELRLRCHIEEEVAFIGLGLRDTPLHRRPWRSIPYDGQLHTPVAAAMAYALAPKPGSLIIDPFCGSGTILIESAIQHPQCRHLGHDIEPAALDIARESADLAAVSLELEYADSLQTSPAEPAYYLISNPPWDEKHRIEEKHIADFADQLGRWVSGSSGAVLLLPEQIAELVRRSTPLPMEKLTQTRIRGKLASIIRFKRD